MPTPLAIIRATDPRKPSQRSVCKAIGISQAHYSKLESGTVPATADTAAKLVEFFQHRISEIQILYPERYPNFEVHA